MSEENDVFPPWDEAIKKMRRGLNKYKPKQYPSCLICHTTMVEDEAKQPCLCSEECRREYQKQQDEYRWP